MFRNFVGYILNVFMFTFIFTVFCDILKFVMIYALLGEKNYQIFVHAEHNGTFSSSGFLVVYDRASSPEVTFSSKRIDLRLERRWDAFDDKQQQQHVKLEPSQTSF